MTSDLSYERQIGSLGGNITRLKEMPTTNLILTGSDQWK